MSALSAARGAWRKLAPQPLRAALAPLIGQAYHQLIVRKPWDDGPQPGPIHVVGLESDGNGIATGARLAVRALEALGAPVAYTAVSFDHFDWVAPLKAKRAAGAWIFHLNPPELVAALGRLEGAQPCGPRFGYWAWELPRAPASWLREAVVVSEIWAPSRYTAEAFEGAKAPVRVVPHPLFRADYEGVAAAARSADFLAVSLFDFNSSAARKNPQGAVAAFRRAFGDDRTAQLVIKTQNGRSHPEAMQALLAAAGDGVQVIDETWTRGRVLSLIKSADVLISLHRAEGFGLTLAEAMVMGVPVVATGWSGNLDFMDEASAVLVPSASVAVDDPQGIYARGAWAEPDTAAAAEALRRLRAEPRLGEALAAKARERAFLQLSPEAWFQTLPSLVRQVAGTAA